MKKDVEAIIAISPGNSHFTAPVLENLLRETTQQYAHITAFVPDIPAINTYLALGYAFNRAKEKAVTKGGNHIKSKLRRAMQNLNLNEKTVRILDWAKDIAPERTYTAALSNIENLYNCSTAFRAAANDATAQVLCHSGRTIEDINAATTQGVKYLLAELAFIEAAGNILRVPTADVIYHKPWPAYENLIAGTFDGQKRPHLGFRVVP